jgi:hypothetical protein
MNLFSFKLKRNYLLITVIFSYIVLVSIIYIRCEQNINEKDDQKKESIISNFYTISEIEENQIRSLKKSFKEHTRTCSDFSNIDPYLDCDAFRKILRFKWKAVPYFIEDIGIYYLIYMDDQSQLNNLGKSQKDNLLPFFVLFETLRRLPPGKEVKWPIKGLEITDCFFWLEWWEKNKSRYHFNSKNPPNIPETKIR